uniref:TetR/AcrR family transcriptional regulator n=1 Tax=Marinobacterium profundum TaxID=1714300 RepID=UPI000831E709|nr:TetR/AcrR family transcriptional regulator [Marinobacterium profundum]
MARVQFDREQVIQDCTQLFWQKGFSGASMQNVVQATGLKPGSLYLAFGSKEGLYQAALEHYAGQSQAALCQILEAAPSVGAGICQHLRRMIEASEKAGYCSCFLVKSQLELAATGGDLHRRVCAYLTEIEDLYAQYLERDYPQDQARQYATSVMMHVFGIRVYGYLERDRDTLLAAVKGGLPWLPWDSCDQAAGS